MEHLLSRTSREIAKEEDIKLRKPTNDLEYNYGRLELDEQTRKICIFVLIGEKIERLL